jgi:hypothetical protein
MFRILCADCTPFPSLRFFPTSFPLQGFNEAILKALKKTQDSRILYNIYIFFPLGFSLTRF